MKFPKPKKAIKPRKPIRNMSVKRQGWMAAYMVVRKEFLKDHLLCEAGKSVCCTGKAKDIHHVSGRCGNLLTNVRFFMPVCRHCHDWIGANPTEARKLGWLCGVGQWNKPV